jgi:glutamate formiminotransferase / formiminotetrahydrofolate cyclodeaminase
MQKLIECVPNFSEGRDMPVIKQITDEIEKIEGVKLLDVDGGYATNRTVVTFVGTPEAVIEAAFQAIKKAGEVIDMSKHTGEHPRMGATDVCPLIPIANMTMEETVVFAHKLAKRVGEELQIPVYCYEEAALHPNRKNLATIRAGEYEGLVQKIQNPEWKPDFGKPIFNTKSGATVIGARDFLIAYNFNLNTTSVRRANSVAFDVREAGRVVEKDGKKVLDQNGEPLRTAGSCPATKAIGWYIAEYGIAQVSMNLTNINVTPLHIAFDEVCKSATNRGMRVTGSELVGLVPLKVMVEAGKHFLRKQQRSVGVSEAELIHIAVKSMGMDELKPFDANKKIIEYLLKDAAATPLVNQKLNQFAHETASESPAPGGGSVAAYVGALGVSLGTMVANLSAHKKGWDSRWEEFSDWAAKGQVLKDKLLHLVDEDTKSFNAIMAAFGLPKETETEKEIRSKAIQAATKYAIEVPLQVMETALHSFNLLLAMASEGNPNSVSDAGVGALCACAAVRGAYLNVKINAASYKDKEFVNLVLAKAQRMEAKAVELEEDVLDIVNTKI